VNAAAPTDALQSVPLCRGLDREAAQKLLALAKQIAFVKGAQLVRQNEPARGAFLIRKGQVEARVALPGGGALTVAELGDGDVFGEMALIERGVCSASVHARTHVDGRFLARGAPPSTGARSWCCCRSSRGSMRTRSTSWSPRRACSSCRAREAACLLEFPRNPFLAHYEGSSTTSVSLQRAIHRSLHRSLARTNTLLTRLISHARLAAATQEANELETALHGQIWREARLP